MRPQQHVDLLVGDRQHVELARLTARGRSALHRHARLAVHVVLSQGRLATALPGKIYLER